MSAYFLSYNDVPTPFDGTEYIHISQRGKNFKIAAADLAPAPVATVWGSIGGTITDQTDLVSYINGLGFITAETDPIFTASGAYGITAGDRTNWNAAYGWGNHAAAGYLTALPAHNHDASAITTGILAQARGGTGFGTYATGSLLYASATDVLSKLAVGTNGQVLTLVSGLPVWAAAGGGASLSALTPAIAVNIIDNLAFQQEWKWNTLAGGSGLKLSSNNTTAAANNQKLFELELSGANATAGQTTYGLYSNNIKTGTSSVNVGGYFSASGGSVNYAAIFNSGIVCIGATSAPYNIYYGYPKVYISGGYIKTNADFYYTGSINHYSGGNGNIGIGGNNGGNPFSSGIRNVGIGEYLASPASTEQICIGRAQTTGTYAIAIGTAAYAQGGSTAIGFGARAVTGSFAMGTQYGIESKVGGQFTVEALQWYIGIPAGGGNTDQHANGYASLNSRAAWGTNRLGANLNLCGGLSTGFANSSDVIFRTAKPIASGTTDQTLYDRWYVKGGLGQLSTQPQPNAAAILDIGTAGKGVLIPRLTQAEIDAIANQVTDIIITSSTILNSNTFAISFSGGGGTGATASVQISGNSMVAINITNCGSGYTSAPTIVFTGTGGSPAATAVIGPTEGLTVYNKTIHEYQFFNGTNWRTITST